MDRVPEFWDWLIHHGNKGNIKIPQEIYEELKNGSDELASWIRKDHVSSALRFNEDVSISHVRQVTSEGYASDLTDDELERPGYDPFLIAYALVDTKNRTIVTTEISKPKRKRGNRHIPDVCKHLGITCSNTFELTTLLNFSTAWNR